MALAPLDVPLDVLPFDLGPHDPLNAPGYVAGWRISSYFGGRIDPFTGVASNHGGTDVVMPTGTPLYAAVSGPVWAGWDSSGGGNWITLNHATLPARFGYGHLDRFAIPLGWGWVDAGTLIGWSGSTGRSTGPHLHLAYDNADANTAYDDIFEVMMEAAFGNRYPSGPVKENPMSDELLQGIRGDIAKIYNIVAPFGYRDEVAWDMKDQTINGVAVAVRPGITEAGWASRPYLVKTIDSDFVYELRRNGTGWYLVHVPDETARAVLVKTGVNPHVVELAGDEAAWVRSLEGVHPDDRG